MRGNDTWARCITRLDPIIMQVHEITSETHVSSPYVASLIELEISLIG